MNSVVGIDEVGRGPLAGPLSVCALKLTPESQFYFSRDIKDSKKLTEKKRIQLFNTIKKEAREGRIVYAVSSVSARTVDTMGISKALLLATGRALKKLQISNIEPILLDGSLKAPSAYRNQKAIIKGDESETSIALASIVAKVSRDTTMYSYAKKWPEYGFENNKGYGTESHYKAIRHNGLCKIHRRSFLKKVLISSKEIETLE